MKNLEFRALEVFKSHNFTQEDAEALIEYIREAKTDQLATKSELIKETTRLELKMSELEIRMTKEMRDNKISIIQWMVGLILGQLTFLFGLIKLIGVF